MSGRYLVFLTLLTALIGTCLGNVGVSLPCPSQPLCSGQLYTATCANAPIDSFSWQLVDRNGMSTDLFSSDDYSNSSMLGTVSYGDVDFSFYQETSHSITVNFTVAPVLDGYWLVCSAMINNNTYDSNCTIDVSTVTTPQNLSLDFSTLTNTSIIANWTSWSDNCLQNYLINTTASNGQWWNATIPSTQQYYSIWARPGLPASTTYRLTVTPIGYAGPNTDRTVSARPIIFDVPPQVTDLRKTHMPIAETTADGTPINVTIRWSAMMTFRPRTRAYFIRHNATRHLQMMSSGSGSGSMDNDDNPTPWWEFRINVPMGQRVNSARLNMGARIGDTYTVYVTPNNLIGNGTAASYTFTLQYEPPTPTTSMVMPPATSTSVEMTMSPTVTATESSGLATWAIAVIAVVVGIVVALIVVAIVIAIVVFCMCTSAAKKQEEHEMTEGTKL